MLQMFILQFFHHFLVMVIDECCKYRRKDSTYSDNDCEKRIKILNRLKFLWIQNIISLRIHCTADM